MDITKEKIQKIVSAGTTALFTTKGIDDFAMKYLIEAGILAVRRVDKKDIRRIAKCTGAQVILTMATMDGDNAFVFIKGCSATKASTVILRGANDFMLEEADR